MLQFIVIFSLSVAGSLVALSAELLHRFLVRRARSEFMTAGQAAGPGRGATRGGGARLPPPLDPVITFGSILACYGALALVVVCALPAPLALERTVLTFAFLCVGGLLGEIAKSSSTITPESDSDASDGETSQSDPPSRGLSLTLALVLNLAFAVLGSGQGLIDIVPPALLAKSAPQSEEMQPILVVAQRPAESRESAIRPEGL